MRRLVQFTDDVGRSLALLGGPHGEGPGGKQEQQLAWVPSPGAAPHSLWVVEALPGQPDALRVANFRHRNSVLAAQGSTLGVTDVGRAVPPPPLYIGQEGADGMHFLVARGSQACGLHGDRDHAFRVVVVGEQDARPPGQAPRVGGAWLTWVLAALFAALTVIGVAVAATGGWLRGTPPSPAPQQPQQQQGVWDFGGAGAW